MINYDNSQRDSTYKGKTVRWPSTQAVSFDICRSLRNVHLYEQNCYIAIYDILCKHCIDSVAPFFRIFLLHLPCLINHVRLHRNIDKSRGVHCDCFSDDRTELSLINGNTVSSLKFETFRNPAITGSDTIMVSDQPPMTLLLSVFVYAKPVKSCFEKLAQSTEFFAPKGRILELKSDLKKSI